LSAPTMPQLRGSGTVALVNAPGYDAVVPDVKGVAGHD